MVDRSQLWRGVAVAILSAGCVLGPLALGGTWRWAQCGLELAAATSTALWCGLGRAKCTAIVVPLLAVAFLCAQLVALPDSLLMWVAPLPAGAWKTAQAVQGKGWSPITVNPSATAEGIRRLFLGIALVAMVRDVSVSLSHRKALSLAMTLAFVFITATAFIFPVSKTDRIMLGFIDLKGPIIGWKTPLEPAIQTTGVGYLDWVTVGGQRYRADGGCIGDGFGPYICSNHFAGVMYLTLPAAIATWLTMTRTRLPVWIRLTAAVTIYGLILLMVGFVADSRAGAASLLLSGLVMAALCLPQGGARRITAALAVAWAVSLVGFVVLMCGWFPSVAGGLQGVLPQQIIAMLREGRAGPTAVAMRMLRGSPILGIGLGAFGDLFPRYINDDLTYYFAHNDYAQYLAETGLGGALLALALVTWLFYTRGHGPESKESTHDICRAAAWASLAALAVHSAVDWNLHVPANAFLACILVGVATGGGENASTSVGNETNQRSNRTLAVAKTARCAFLKVVFVCACLWSVVLSVQTAVADMVKRELKSAIVAARLESMGKGTGSAASELQTAIASGMQMIHWAPANTQLAMLLGQANLHLSLKPQPMDDANACLAAAQRWFLVARRNSAALRGLPEPVLPAERIK